MLDRNSVLTLVEECFWDEIETFTIECVSEFGTDELEIIFTDYLVDYASLDEIEELKITDMEIECDDGVETVSGEMRLDILVEGYAHWDGSEEYLGTEETEIRYKYSFEMMNGKVISEIELEMS